MDDLAWLVGHQLRSFAWRDYQWVVAFDKDASLVVACLWRLVEGGRVRYTSEDDGQQFGLPAPVDAAAEVNSRLRIYAGVPICQIFYHEITGEVTEYCSKYQHNRDIQPSLLFEELAPERNCDPQLPL